MSFKINWFGLLAVQGTFKSLHQDLLASSKFKFCFLEIFFFFFFFNILNLRLTESADVVLMGTEGRLF